MDALCIIIRTLMSAVEHFSAGINLCYLLSIQLTDRCMDINKTCQNNSFKVFMIKNSVRNHEMFEKLENKKCP